MFENIFFESIRVHSKRFCSGFEKYEGLRYVVTFQESKKSTCKYSIKMLYWRIETWDEGFDVRIYIFRIGSSLWKKNCTGVEKGEGIGCVLKNLVRWTSRERRRREDETDHEERWGTVKESVENLKIEKKNVLCDVFLRLRSDFAVFTWWYFCNVLWNLCTC